MCLHYFLNTFHDFHYLFKKTKRKEKRCPDSKNAKKVVTWASVQAPTLPSASFVASNFTILNPNFITC